MGFSKKITKDVQQSKHSCARHRGLRGGQEGPLEPKKRRTIEIRECPIILIFHQHVAELDLCAIHVLPNDEQLRRSPPLNSSVSNDVPDLDGQRGIQVRENRLRSEDSARKSGPDHRSNKTHHSGVHAVKIVDAEQVKQYLRGNAIPDPNHRDLPIV